MLHGSKHGRSGPNDNLHLIIPDSSPFIITLSKGQAAVENGDIVPKTPLEASHRLGRQGNLRYKNNDLFPLLQDKIRCLHIDLGLAAACYTMQQQGSVSDTNAHQNRLHCFFLLFVEYGRDGGNLLCLPWIPIGLFFPDPDISPFPKGVNTGPGCTGQLQQLPCRHPVSMLQGPQNTGHFGGTVLHGGNPLLQGICIGQINHLLCLPLYIPPDTGRDAAADRFDQHTVILLFHPVNQGYHAFSQNRMGIHQLFQRLDFFLRDIGFFVQRQNIPLEDTAAERDLNPQADFDFVGKGRRNAVMKQFIQGRMRLIDHHSGILSVFQRHALLSPFPCPAEWESGFLRQTKKGTRYLFKTMR